MYTRFTQRDSIAPAVPYSARPILVRGTPAGQPRRCSRKRASAGAEIGAADVQCAYQAAIEAANFDDEVNTLLETGTYEQPFHFSSSHAEQDGVAFQL
jgi:hypothetical protein